MNTKKHRKAGASGATMIEMLVYIFILVLLVSAVIYTLLTLGNLYRSIKATAGIKAAANVALERMTREIRGATSIDTANSILNASPGKVTLNTLDQDGATTTVEFLMIGNTPHIKEAGVDMGPLSGTGVRVTSLIFRSITAARSQGVKIEMHIESGSGKSYKTESFYATAVLRGSYPIQ